MQNDRLKFKNDFKKRAFDLSLKVIEFIEALPKDKTCEVISNQLLRSATSIGANIAEASAASSRKDYTNYFNHSLKSANETKYWLELLINSGKSNLKITKSLLDETSELAKILASSILTLRGKR